MVKVGQKWNHKTQSWSKLSLRLWMTVFVIQFENTQFSCSVLSYSLWPNGLKHTRLPCPSPVPGACSNSCLSSCWFYPTISSSVIPFSSCPQSFPASGSFPMGQFFASGGQSFGASVSASVLPVNIQGWIDWLDLFVVQGTLKSLLQHHSSKASVLWGSVFFIVRFP